MARIFADNSRSIGGTPLVQLRRVTQGCGATVLAKIEGRNPGYSVKCRIGASMIWDAEERGALRPGVEVIEPTSGNTGIALAFVCASRGYPLTLTMPETMSLERRKVLAAFGARLELTPAAQGMRGAIQKAEEIMAAEPSKWFMPHQFENPANPAIHERTTGPEIWNDTDGARRRAGRGRRHRRHHHRREPLLRAYEGTAAAVGGRRAGEESRSSPRRWPDAKPCRDPTRFRESAPASSRRTSISASSIASNVSATTEAIEMARRLTHEEGILSGISCGAAAAVAVRLARQPEFADKVIVAILPDSGERYLSTQLFA